MDLGHDVGEQVRREGGEQAEAHGAGLGVLGVAGDAADRVGLPEDHPGPLDHPLAGVGQEDVARAPLDEGDAELLLELHDLGRQRRLADEARLGGPAEMAVVGHGDQVLEIAQVHRSPPCHRLRSAGRGGLTGSRFARQSVHADLATRCGSGAEVRIRWSKALSAAVDPAPIAITICLYGTVVQSPAANTPGTDVRPRSSITTSPRFESSTVPSSHSVLGSSPIWTKMPSRSTLLLVVGRAVGVDEPGHPLAVAHHLGGECAHDDVDVGQAPQLALEHLVGPQARRRTRAG